MVGDGVTQQFEITEPNADVDTSYVSASVTTSRIGGGGLLALPCMAAPKWPGGNAFTVVCTNGPGAPPNGAELHYIVINLPAHVS